MHGLPKKKKKINTYAYIMHMRAHAHMHSSTYTEVDAAHLQQAVEYGISSMRLTTGSTMQ
jgi:hypothetical protein